MTPEKFAKFRPFTSMVITFTHSKTAASTIAAAGTIARYRGVKKCIPVALNQRCSQSAKLFFVRVDSTVDPISILHRIIETSGVKDASIVHLQSSSRLKDHDPPS